MPPDPSSLFTLKYTQWPYQTGSGPALHSNSLSKKGAVVILCTPNKAPLRAVIIFNGTLIKAFPVYRYYLWKCCNHASLLAVQKSQLTVAAKVGRASQVRLRE